MESLRFRTSIKDFRVKSVKFRTRVDTDGQKCPRSTGPVTFS
jgi:hypothetical protein